MLPESLICYGYLYVHTILTSGQATTYSTMPWKSTLTFRPKDPTTAEMGDTSNEPENVRPTEKYVPGPSAGEEAEGSNENSTQTGNEKGKFPTFLVYVSCVPTSTTWMYTTVNHINE